ncbi:TPA: hypothetical protein R4D87_004755 [Salmonella enterica subsp. enterica serovar Javiana]|nr:hypothetical protein [Salmonella enterica subsp. enterica serovar Javiana]
MKLAELPEETEACTPEEWYVWVEKYIKPKHAITGSAWERISTDGKKARFVAMLQTDRVTEEFILYMAGDPDEFLSKLKIRQIPPIIIPWSSETPGQ